MKKVRALLGYSTHKEVSMMKKLVVFLSFTALGMVMIPIAQAETVRGEGRYVEQTLDKLPTFYAIDVRGDAQVDVWQKDKQGVMVNGKSNLVALANIRVEDKTLIIDFARPVHVKGPHALHVTVMAPQLHAINVHNKGRVRVRGGMETAQLALMATDKSYLTGDSIKADTLRVQAINHAEIDLERLHAKDLEAASFDKAEIELSGHAEMAKLTNNGHEDMDAADLRVDHAQVVVNAKGDVEVFAMHSLNANANGHGEIVYHGRPTLTREGNMKKIQPAFED